MVLRKKTYNTLLILLFIFLATSSNAQPPDLCSPYHLPLKQIQVGKINQKNISNFMNWVWGAPTTKESSSIAGKVGKAQCWKLGEWKKSLCLEPMKLYEKKIDNENYVFLIVTQHFNTDGEGCWSKNEDDCNEGAPGPTGSSILGLFSFKRLSENTLEQTNYSGLCEFAGGFSIEEVNLKQNGPKSYLWTIESGAAAMGEVFSAVFMIPALDNSKNKPYDVAKFSVYYDNAGRGQNEGKEVDEKIKYSFIKSNKKHYDLSLKYYCADIRYPKNMDMDVLERKKGALKYQRTLISKYSNIDQRYMLPITEKYGSLDISDIISWFNERAHCPIIRISK